MIKRLFGRTQNKKETIGICKTFYEEGHRRLGEDDYKMSFIRKNMQYTGNIFI